MNINQQLTINSFNCVVIAYVPQLATIIHEDRELY